MEMKVYAKINNAIIKADESLKFWVFDRNEELLCSVFFSYASDAINCAYEHQEGLICE